MMTAILTCRILRSEIPDTRRSLVNAILNSLSEYAHMLVVMQSAKSQNWVALKRCCDLKSSIRPLFENGRVCPNLSPLRQSETSYSHSYMLVGILLESLLLHFLMQQITTIGVTSILQHIPFPSSPPTKPESSHICCAGDVEVNTMLRFTKEQNPVAVRPHTKAAVDRMDAHKKLH